MSTGLAIKAYTNIISGGYPGEEYGASRQYADWTDVPLNGSVVSSYHYRDSDYSLNHRSTRVVVTILDKWTSVLEPDNSYTITVDSYLLGIERGDRRGYAGPTPRSIMVRQNTVGPWLRQWPRTTTNAVNTIFSGNLSIGRKVWHLYPEGTPGQMTESSTGSIYYRSTVAGYENSPPPSMYIDEFFMGMNFKNTLPRRLNPPTLNKIVQTPDICLYQASVGFRLTMGNIPSNDNDEHTVLLQIAADNNFTAPINLYAKARRSADGTTYFNFPDVNLKPNTTYYYRAILNQPDRYLTDWKGGEFKTIPVIHPSEAVPPIDDDVCNKLRTNILVER